MKLINKIFGWLFAIGKDKYMHISLGSFIVSVFLILFCWLPLWANIMASVIVVSGLAVFKEYGIDSKADLLDIAFTVGGGIIVILPILLINILL